MVTENGNSHRLVRSPLPCAGRECFFKNPQAIRQCNTGYALGETPCINTVERIAKALGGQVGEIKNSVVGIDFVAKNGEVIATAKCGELITLLPKPQS